MIESSCTCGAPVVTPESGCQTRVVCRSCGEGIRIVCAEALPEGAGLGDFDIRLVMTESPAGSGEQILLGGVEPLEIGKLPERQIFFEGNLVSRLHARLVRLDFGPSRWEIQDNNSTNGVFVNEHRVTQQELHVGDIVRIGEYELRYEAAEPVAVELPDVAPPTTVGTTVRKAKVNAEAPAVWDGTGGIACPSCRSNLAPTAKICVACGIYVATGRPVITSKGFDESDLAIRADTWIRIVSWVVPFGLFPVASEAFGTKKPYAIWVIAGLTALVSIGWWVAMHGGNDFETASPGAMSMMLWTTGHSTRTVENLSDLDLEDLDSMLGSHGVGFHWYQLFTHALIHADLMHIAGNMVFLLVFGIRVNELIGNLKTFILYPILGALAGLSYMMANLDSNPVPLLGASGAIMGLAGMYFIFFPIQRVHMAIWLRGGWMTRWQCFYKMFTMRGVWLLVLWVAFNDGLPMLLGSRHDHVAHWAHVGGFTFGALIAIALLIGRQANAHGGDLLSVALGKYAWTLLGKPSTRLNVPVTPETRGTSMSYPA